MDMDSSGADGNCGTNTARGDPFQPHNGVGSNHQLNNAKATVRNKKMKLITTWHCTEILQGEESEIAPREWLILVGPGEDLIFEVKTAHDRPASLTSRQRGTSAHGLVAQRGHSLAKSQMSVIDGSDVCFGPVLSISD